MKTILEATTIIHNITMPLITLFAISIAFNEYYENKQNTHIKDDFEKKELSIEFIHNSTLEEIEQIKEIDITSTKKTQKDISKIANIISISMDSCHTYYSFIKNLDITSNKSHYRVKLSILKNAAIINIIKLERELVEKRDILNSSISNLESPLTKDFKEKMVKLNMMTCNIKL